MGVYIDCRNVHGPSHGLIHNTQKKKFKKIFLSQFKLRINATSTSTTLAMMTNDDDHKQPQCNTVSTFFLLIHHFFFFFTVKHECKHEMDHHHHYYHLHNQHHNTPPPQYTATATDSNSDSIVTKNDGLETHWCLKIPCMFYFYFILFFLY